MAKLTCFMLSPVLVFFENEILNKTGLKKSEFHRRMIQFFFENELDLTSGIFKVPPKDEVVVREQIYLVADDQKLMDDFIDNHKEVYGKKCTYTHILTQALVSYGVHLGMKLMAEEQEEDIGLATGILYILDEGLIEINE